MKCTKCGTANDAANKYCKECGKKIPDPSKATRLNLDEHLRVGEFVYLAYRESEAGHLDNAIEACQGALRIKDDNPATHALLASLYERKGDLALAIYEYERTVSLNPGSLDDRRKLEQLRAQLLTPVSIPTPSRPRFRLSDIKWLRNPQAVPWVMAACAFALFVVIGSLLLRGGSARSGSSAAAPRGQTQTQLGPNMGMPGQPGVQGPGAVGPNQPGVQQGPGGETDQAAGGNPAPADKTKPGIPPVRVPGASPGSQPAKEQPRNTGNEKPVITPIITPMTKPPPSGNEVTPAPQTSKSLEQRGSELQRAGKYDEAIVAYKEALNQTSDPAGVYQKIGLSYQRLGQPDAAIDNYNRGIKAYRDELASGRSQTEVQSGIRACEAGIEVSRNMKQ